MHSGTAKFLGAKVKNKKGSMGCGYDTYSVVHIPWVFIMTSLMTSLFSRILIGNIGLQHEQRIVIKFLVAESVSSAQIHQRLAAVFKDD